MNKLCMILTVLSVGLYATNATAMEGKPGHLQMAADCSKTEEFKNFVLYVLNDYHKEGYYPHEDGDGNTILHEAAAFGCEANVKTILDDYHLDDYNDGAALLNKENYKGETPLDKAHYFKKPRVEQLLKQRGGKYAVYKELN